MVIHKDVYIPSDEELTVQEVNLSTAFLKAGAFHLGTTCAAANNEFMLCREEEKDPRKCLKEGKNVTACSLRFFQDIKKNCAQEFTDYGECLDKASSTMEFKHCRVTQSFFDSCMATKMGIERPSYGYFTEAKVHKTERPKPPMEPPAVYPDALPELPSEDIPRHPPRHGSRYVFLN